MKGKYVRLMIRLYIDIKRPFYLRMCGNKNCIRLLMKISLQGIT